MSDEWELRYRSRQFNDSGPLPLLVDTCKHLAAGRALDLACGVGRNALWLAAQGWQVTAVDRSPSALQLLQTRAVEACFEIDTHLADLERHEFDLGQARWDLIVVSYYLQRDLLSTIPRALAPAGIAIVVVHLADPDRPSPFSLRHEELRDYFRDLTILHSHEGPPTGADTGRHVAEIVVRL